MKYTPFSTIFRAFYLASIKPRFWCRCETEWEGGEVALAGRDRTELRVEAACAGAGRVTRAEHVHVTVDISSNTRRGLFSIMLESPSGTVSQLLAPRPLDNSLSGNVS